MGIFRIPLRAQDEPRQLPVNLLQCLQSPSLWATLFFVGLALTLGA